MKCSICPEHNEVKYKCPKCRIPYCSVSCWKEHKSIGCKPDVEVKEKFPVSEPPKSFDLHNFPTEDTVPIEKLKELENNQELKNILCNRHLRDMLVAIDKSSNPSAAMQQAMLEPIFVEFANECLKVVEPSEDSEN